MRFTNGIIRNGLPGRFAVLLVLAVTACSHHGGPSQEQIGKALALKLPDGLKVDDIDVQVSQNQGSKVEPDYETRSNIRLEFTDDIYKVVDHLGDKDVVKKIYADGDDIKGVLITEATPSGDDGWHVRVERLDIPSINGSARSHFEPGTYVLQGSSDYDDLKQQLAAAQKKAEEEARQQAQAKAEAQAERVAALRKTLVGTWISHAPLIHDHAIWSSNDGHRLGLELVLDPAEKNSGEGTAVVYDFGNPGDQVKVPVGYVLDDDGRYATVSFVQKAHLQSANFTVDGQWHMTPDGKLTISSNSHRWDFDVQKSPSAVSAWQARVDRYNEQQKALQDLAVKYNAANATGTFDKLPLQLPDGQWGTATGMFIVVGRTTGNISGDGVYNCNSDVATAAVHAGLLRPGQAGVLNITYTSRNQFRVNGWVFRNTTRHGVASRRSSGWHGCTMKLVNALPQP